MTRTTRPTTSTRQGDPLSEANDSDIPTVEPDSLDPAQLAGALARYAAGSPGNEAAVMLLCDHGRWLRRPDFRHHLDIVEDHYGQPVAAIDWHGAITARFACSRSEEQILRLAAELAGVDTATPLAELLTGLDHHNQTAVLRAIAHAVGHHP